MKPNYKLLREFDTTSFYLYQMDQVSYFLTPLLLLLLPSSTECFYSDLGWFDTLAFYRFLYENYKCRHNFHMPNEFKPIFKKCHVQFSFESMRKIVYDSFSWMGVQHLVGIECVVCFYRCFDPFPAYELELCGPVNQIKVKQKKNRRTRSSSHFNEIGVQLHISCQTSILSFCCPTTSNAQQNVRLRTKRQNLKKMYFFY